MGPRAGLDGRGKSRHTGIRFPDRPARSQSLYRLRYPAHLYILALQLFSNTRKAKHAIDYELNCSSYPNLQSTAVSVKVLPVCYYPFK